MYVYVISAPNGRVKIGITIDPARRLKQIQAFSPLPVSLAYTHEHPDARSIERAVHLALKKQRVQGEWFEAGAARAIQAVQCATEALGKSPSGASFGPAAYTANDFRARLEAGGISHEEAAQFLGTHVGAIKRYANGRRHVPPRIIKLIELMRPTARADTIRC